MSLEALKLLSAKGINIEYIPGGEPEITPEVVAAALGFGHLSEMASLYCRIKYQYQEELRPKLERKVLIKHTLEYAIAQDWKCSKLLRKLGQVALDEALYDKVCKTCRGRGEEKVGDSIDECKSCSGTGKRSFTKSGIAERLGVDATYFSRSLYDKYRLVLNVYYELQHEIVVCLKKIG